MPDITLMDAVAMQLDSVNPEKELDKATRRVTIRMNVVEYYQLGRLANRLNMTKSGAAEFIFGHALHDALSVADLPNLTDADKEEIRKMVNEA